MRYQCNSPCGYKFCLQPYDLVLGLCQKPVFYRFLEQNVCINGRNCVRYGQSVCQKVCIFPMLLRKPPLCLLFSLTVLHPYNSVTNRRFDTTFEGP